eukprot:321543-Prymnesium_polylepis.1
MTPADTGALASHLDATGMRRTREVTRRGLGTWLKILLHCILPDVQRALYLDTDCLVFGAGAIGNFWAEAFDGCEWLVKMAGLPGYAIHPGMLALELDRMRAQPGSFESIARATVHALVASGPSPDGGPGIATRDGEKPNAAVVGIQAMARFVGRRGMYDNEDQGLMFALLSERPD